MGRAMLVTIQLANDVRRLGRDGMTVNAIAATLRRPVSDIMETLRMLGLPLPGETVEERAAPTEEERAAVHAKMPKKWQDRRPPNGR